MFAFIHDIVVPLLPKPKALLPGKLEPYNEMLSSHFHAVVVSVGTIAVLAFYPDFISQPITFWNSSGANVLKFSVGYFAYDLLVTIRSTVHSRNMKTFYIVHHAIGGAALTYVLAHKRCAGTALQCLLMEVNSVVTQRRSALLYCGKTG